MHSFNTSYRETGMLGIYAEVRSPLFFAADCFGDSRPASLLCWSTQFAFPHDLCVECVEML
jgi:hypothetical protein